jgi:hypothetical protein
MIYRGLGFLSVICFGSSPIPLTPSVAQPATHSKNEKERQLADEKGAGFGGGARSYDGQKAWSSFYHLILSGYADDFSNVLA